VLIVVLQVPVEKIVYKDVIKYVDVVVEREVQVPVEVERRVEVPVPYEKIVIVPPYIPEFPYIVSFPELLGRRAFRKGRLLYHCYVHGLVYMNLTS
jgi:hypothetical protein